jgi:hypothetical protein
MTLVPVLDRRLPMACGPGTDQAVLTHRSGCLDTLPVCLVLDAWSPEERAERGAWVGCIAGALSRAEYEAGLTAAGFTAISVTFTHPVGDGLHSAIIKATKPVDISQPTGVTVSAGQATLPLASQLGCC